jgi:hypothetical protein
MTGHTLRFYLDGRCIVEDLDVNERIISKQILEQKGEREWTILGDRYSGMLRSVGR